MGLGERSVGYDRLAPARAARAANAFKRAREQRAQEAGMIDDDGPDVSFEKVYTGTSYFFFLMAFKESRKKALKFPHV